MHRFLLLLCAGLLCAGEVLDPAVAVVGGEVITESRLGAGIPADLDPAQLSHARRDRLPQLVDLIAVRQHLARLGATVPDRVVEERMEALRKNPGIPTCGCHDAAPTLAEYLAFSFLTEAELRLRERNEAAIAALTLADWARLNPGGDAEAVRAAGSGPARLVRRAWSLAIEAGEDEHQVPERGARSWSLAARVLADLTSGTDLAVATARLSGGPPPGPDPGRLVTLDELERLGVPRALSEREESGLVPEPVLSERRWLVTRWQAIGDAELLGWLRAGHAQRFHDELLATARAQAEIRLLGLALTLPP